MSGGVLDADNSLTVSGALSHTADITIDVADNKTLTYSGVSDKSWSKYSHFELAEEALVSGGLTLNDAEQQTSAELNYIVDNVSTTVRQFRS